MREPHFNIAADLDTPVSAFCKLAPLEPRTLLESVEGGERVGRYSFIGLGEALRVSLQGDVLQVGGEALLFSLALCAVVRCRCFER